MQSQQDQLQKAREETTGSGRLRSRHSGLHAFAVFRDTAVRHPCHVFVADDNQIGPLVFLLPTATHDQPHPQRRPSKEVPLPDQLQDKSKDESLCCFRDFDFISGDC